MDQWHPNDQLLKGLHVVVVAGTPQEFEHSALSSSVLEAEEAVADIVRAVVAHGGAVSVFGDESLAMIALTVAGEYTTPQTGEVSETPRVFAVLPRRGEEDPAAAEGGDPFDVFRKFGIGSFERMVDPIELLQHRAGNASAMVVIGECPERAIETFRKYAGNAPVFSIAASGGLAKALADGEVKDAKGVRALDREIAQDPRYALKQEGLDDPENPERVLPPVALAAQRVIEELLNARERSNER